MSTALSSELLTLLREVMDDDPIVLTLSNGQRNRVAVLQPMSGLQSILVTGASGFIGRRLVQRLVREGAGRVTVLSRDGARAAADGEAEA